MHATEAFGAEEVSLCSCLTSALDGIRGGFTPGGRAGRICPVNRRLGEPQKRSAYFKVETSLFPGLDSNHDSPAFQPLILFPQALKSC